MSRKKSSEPPDAAQASPPEHPQRAWILLEQTLRACLDNQVADNSAKTRDYEALVPAEQRANVEMILDSYKPGGAGKSYRIGLIVQSAFALTGDPGARIDMVTRPSGARGKPAGVAHKVHLLLSSAHISSVEDAYQNIAKNSVRLDRGNFSEFDDFLRWASKAERNRREIHAVFNHACSQIIATARPISPMPAISQGELTFARVTALFNDMLDVPSKGAHEQFIIASLLHAKVEQLNVPGHRIERMETKTLTAADASSRAAADIQIKVGSRAIEAFEVTANDWSEKVHAASATMRMHDLTRLHIVAAVQDWRAMLEQLRRGDDDVSVLEIRAFVAALTAELTKASRVAALKRLYELLDRCQNEISLVNAYVERLRSHGIAN